MKKERLNESLRYMIARLLLERKSITEIAKELGKAGSTISREIRNHLTVLHTGGHGMPFNECANRFGCKIMSLCEGCFDRKCRCCKVRSCSSVCRSFTAEKCEKLSKPPYVCNGCKTRALCTLEKRFYNAGSAQKEYEAVWSESHTGIALSEKEITRIDGIISPLLKQGQSLNCVLANHQNELMIGRSTLYRYVDACLFDARNLDLPRRVRFAKRKKKLTLRINRRCREGRTYEDYKAYLKEHGINALTWYDFFHFRWETQPGTDGEQIEGGEMETTTPEGEQMDEKERDTGVILTCFLRAAERKQQEVKPVKKTRRRTNSKNVAIEKGALINLHNNVISFTLPELQSAFTGVSLLMLPGTPKDFEFDEAGKLNMLSLKDGRLKQPNEIYGAFMMELAQAVKLTIDSDYTADNFVDIYLPELFRSMDIDIRGYGDRRRKDVDIEEQRLGYLMNILSRFDPIVGRTPDGNYYRAASFVSYDRDSETARIATPFIFKILGYAESLEAHHSPLNRLLHSNVGNEPNHAAVELANRILTGVLQRGTRADIKGQGTLPQRKTKRTTTKTDAAGNRETVTEYIDTDKEPVIDQHPQQKSKTVTYRVKHSALIAACPQLAAELEAIENHPDYATNENGEPIIVIDTKTGQPIKKPYNRRQAINAKLKQTFGAANRIILEKSDAPIIYKDFKIETPPPTKSTLDTLYIISHKGRAN